MQLKTKTVEINEAVYTIHELSLRQGGHMQKIIADTDDITVQTAAIIEACVTMDGKAVTGVDEWPMGLCTKLAQECMELNGMTAGND